MFVSSGQFYVFLACVSFGAVLSPMLSLSAGVKALIKIRIVCVLCDITAFTAMAISYVVIANKCGFPSIRAYMPFGFILGIVGYMKTFHITLAKACKFMVKYISKVFYRTQRNKSNGRRKKEKADSCGHGRRGFFGAGVALDDGVSAYSDRG